MTAPLNSTAASICCSAVSAVVDELQRDVQVGLPQHRDNGLPTLSSARTTTGPTCETIGERFNPPMVCYLVIVQIVVAHVSRSLLVAQRTRIKGRSALARTELSVSVDTLHGSSAGRSMPCLLTLAPAIDILWTVALLLMRGGEPLKPRTGLPVSDAGGNERLYPAVEGGGEVPFTPDNPPEVTDERLDHIMIGEPRRRGQAWSGGHGFGVGRGKAEFPETWTRTVVKAAIEQVLSDPASIESIRRKGSTLEFRGVVMGVSIVVVVRGRQGPPKLWTAYPEWTP
jgi:hypothetical protein